MIIGLCSETGKQSGKDTAAAYLVKEHGFERKAFADPLKRSVAALFGIPFSEIDKLKNEEIFVGVGRIGEPEYEQWIQYVGFKALSFREFLQRYGTEAHRDVFGANFWVDLTLPVQGFYPGRAIVVTDVRFREEAERVKLLDGYIINVVRESAAPLIKDPHRSELMDFPELIDWTIENNGTIDELYEKINNILVGTHANW